MKHIALAVVAYAAFALQLAAGPSWAAAGWRVDALVLASAVPLVLTTGNAMVAWVAVIAFLGDVAQPGPLGLGLGVAVVAAMSLATTVTGRRTPLERGLVMLAYITLTTAATHALRELLATTPGVDVAGLVAVTLHTVIAGTVLATTLWIARHTLRVRIASRY